MDASALATSIKSLELVLDSLGSWLSFWTACVVVGLVVEYLPETIKAARERPFRLGAFRLIIGGVLVTAGVAGELVIGFKASKVETQLRTVNTETFAEFFKEAADAQKTAGEANARAAANESEAARLTVIAESERLARVKLEQQVANRDLTLKERTAVSAKVLPFAGQRAVVDVFPVTFEHAAIAGNVLGVLLNAHWTARGFNLLPAPAASGFSSTGDPVPLLVQGIWVQATGDSRSQAAGKALFDALSSTIAKGVFSPEPLANPSDPRVWIYVGDKPTPIQSWVK